MKISQIGKRHERRVYSLFDLMSEVGGFTSVVFIIFYIVVAPVNRYSFTITAAEKLFYGRTRDENIFLSKYDAKVKKFIETDHISVREKEEIQTHWPIKISFS